MPTQVAKSYNQSLMEIVSRYREADQKWPATKQEIAAWAIEQQLWEPEPELLLRRCANDIAVAMKNERHVDVQGRHLRTMVATRLPVTNEDGKTSQVTMWDDLRNGTSEHITLGLQQKYDQAGGDLCMIYVQQCSLNDNHDAFRNAPIQFSFDFTEYVRESGDDESSDPRLPR